MSEPTTEELLKWIDEHAQWLRDTEKVMPLVDCSRELGIFSALRRIVAGREKYDKAVGELILWSRRSTPWCAERLGKNINNAIAAVEAARKERAK